MFSRVSSLRQGFQLLVLLSAAVVCGCGGDSQPTVSGKVTLDGKPLENGAISFVPADGATATAGGIITNGEYTVEVPAGAKKVEITAAKVVGQRPAYEGNPNSPMIDITESIIPERYNTKSELTREVKAGENTLDFELTSS